MPHFRGAHRAEIIPIEPDPGNAGEGKRFSYAKHCCRSDSVDFFTTGKMKKTTFLIAAFTAATALSQGALAQYLVSGRVVDQATNTPIEGVQVGLEGTGAITSSSAEGTFSLPATKAGYYRLRTGAVGYFPYNHLLHVVANVEVTILLEPKNRVSEEVIVRATRTAATDPTTSTTLTKEELEKTNLGQDLPILIQQATSVTSTSDAGAGVGYTGISIRGSDATRINVTMNGIPVNDAESHGLFWVNMPDFASSVSSIQIQRGVGTSTNGSAAFGASLNIQTNTLQRDAYAETNFSAGSFNTLKTNVMAGTGLLNGRWAADVRLSQIQSDGFIDRASSDLKSAYISGGYYGKKGLLKFNYITGNEKTYQAWNGIPQSRLDGNRNAMEDYIARNGLSSSDSTKLINSASRTYNPFTYHNQTDNYRQTHYQLLYSYEFDKRWGLNTALHYTKGAGYYEEFKHAEKFSEYGMAQPVIGDSTLTRTNLIRQRWLDNHFYGATYSLTYNHDKISATLGGSANQYRGNHFGDVIWAQVSTLTDNRFRYYENDALKNDFTTYLKVGYALSTKFKIYGDIQLRNVFYKFEGFDRNLNATDQSVNLLFINPKAGIGYQLNPKTQLYFSYGKSEREPVRDDFVNSSPTSRPKTEKLHNGELGIRRVGAKSRISANYYLMYYRDQLVLTGQINDVGAYIRSNVNESYRTGLEVEFACQLFPQLQLSGNTTLSQNRISSYNYFVDEYDANFEWVGQKSYTLKNAPIAFSPELIAAAEITWLPAKNLEVALIGKAVGRQFLDNTGDNAKSLDPYQFINLRAGYTVYSKWFTSLTFKILVNNVLNQEYEASGYTWGYRYDGVLTTENFYFPQAGRNFLAGLSLRF